jgi:hypothetical protein
MGTVIAIIVGICVVIGVAVFVFKKRDEIESKVDQGKDIINTIKKDL